MVSRVSKLLLPQDWACASLNVLAVIFSLEGVFSFSSVSNRRMYFSRNFYILKILLRIFQPFLSSFLPLMILRRLFLSKMNPVVCVVNFIFSWFFTYTHCTSPCSFTSLNKYTTVPPPPQNKMNKKTSLPWFFLIPKCRLLSTFFFYQCLNQWNVTHVYFTLKYLSMGFWRLLLSHFLKLLPQKSARKIP